MRRLAFVLVACSSKPPRTEPIVAATTDAAPVIAVDAAVPHDAPATTLIPADAAPTVIVTQSDPCGFILDMVYFPSGSSAISKPSEPIVNATAEMFTCFVKLGEISLFEVGGHADDTETNAERLSQERAVTIANALIARGVPATALTAVGYGASQPLDRKNTAAARAKNRRVQFLVLRRSK